MHKLIVAQLQQVFPSNKKFVVSVVKNQAQKDVIALQLVGSSPENAQATAEQLKTVLAQTKYFGSNVAIKPNKKNVNSRYLIIDEPKLLEPYALAALTQELLPILNPTTVEQASTSLSSSSATSSSAVSTTSSVNQAAIVQNNLRTVALGVYALLEPHVGKITDTETITNKDGSVQKFTFAGGGSVSYFLEDKRASSSSEARSHEVTITFPKRNLNKAILGTINVVLAQEAYGVDQGIAYNDKLLAEVNLTIKPFISVGQRTENQDGVSRNFWQLLNDTTLWNKFLAEVEVTHQKISENLLNAYNIVLYQPRLREHVCSGDSSDISQAIVEAVTNTLPASSNSVRHKRKLDEVEGEVEDSDSQIVTRSPTTESGCSIM